MVRITPVASPLPPVDVALRLARASGLAWLDGGLDHGREGRFSYVTTEPCDVVASAPSDPFPLAALDLLRGREAPPDPRSPAAGGAPFELARLPCWVGHVSYAARSPALAVCDPASAVPQVRFARYDAWYVFDHQSQRAYVAADDDTAGARLLRRLESLPLSAAELAFEAGAMEATSADAHRAAIKRALDLIREGELYEINLARRFVAPFAGSALGLFLKMRSASPVPLGYFVEGQGHAVLGRSMERFLRYDAADRRLITSPIKGTLARSGDDERDATRLRADPKEHAEHAMVVDLMRNDLSRVSEVGSVRVDELMAFLPFAGLSHLVSTVSGVARPGLGLLELLSHTFPPGSVTGTPKERVMRAIAELEGVARGVYTGCVGFVDRSGSCSFAVAIRTAVVERGAATYFSGGGIVADSDPHREVAETELKAQLFLRALHAPRS